MYHVSHPHWSKLLISHIKPWMKILCSYIAVRQRKNTVIIVVKASSFCMFPHTFPLPHFLSFPHHSLIASHLTHLCSPYLSPAHLFIQSVTFSWGGSTSKCWVFAFIIDIELNLNLYLSLSIFKWTFNGLFPWFAFSEKSVHVCFYSSFLLLEN